MSKYRIEKLIAFLLCFLMVFMTLPIQVLAEEFNENRSVTMTTETQTLKSSDKARPIIDAEVQEKTEKSDEDEVAQQNNPVEEGSEEHTDVQEKEDKVREETQNSQENLEETEKSTEPVLSTQALRQGVFTYSISKKKVCIVSCDKSVAGAVIIPDTIEGKSVTSIGNSAFENCTNLTEVTIPDSVRSAGQYAFAYCEALKKITLPCDMGYNYYYTFSNTKNIEEIHYTVGESGIIGDAPGSGCSIASRSGSNVKKVILDEGISRIGNYAFSGCSKMVIEGFDEGIISIGDYAFSGCSSMTVDGFDFSKLEKIGRDAFYGTSSITDEVIINTNEIGGYAFEGSGITKITFTDKVTAIPVEFCASCTNLTEVTIPDSVRSAGQDAFAYCEALKKITLPCDMGYVYGRTFSNTSNIEEIHYTVGESGIIGDAPGGGYSIASKSGSSLKKVILDEGISGIGNYAFYNCYNLLKCQVPSSVNSIGENAFYNCKNMTMVVIPDSFAEGFAVENKIDYAYNKNITGWLKVDFNLQNREDYQGASLIATAKDVKTGKILGSGTTYVFGSLPVGRTYTLTLVNEMGDVLAKKEVDLPKKGGVTVEISEAKAIAPVNLIVYGENEENLTAQVKIKWEDQNGKQISSLSSLKQIPVGTELYYTVELGEKLIKAYHQPEKQHYVVQNGNNDLSLTLTPYRQVQLRGKVTCEEEPLSGVSVTVSQHLSDQYETSLTEITDENGDFVFTVFDNAATIEVSKNGYQTQRVELNEITSSMTLDEISLKEVEGTTISVRGTLSRAILFGQAEIELPIINLNDMNITVTNQEKEIKDFVIKGTKIILPEGASAGDTLEIAISSRSNAFVPVKKMIEIDQNKKGTLDLSLSENGMIQVEILESADKSSRVLILDENGKMVWTALVEGDGQVATDALPEAAYKVIVFGCDETMPYPTGLKGIEDMGLQVNTDYLMQEVNVTTGKIEALTFESVPAINSERFGFLNNSSLIYRLNKYNIDKTNYATLTTQASLKQTYVKDAKNLQLIYELPEGLALMDNTLTVNGKSSESFSMNGQTLTVNLKASTDTVRFCLVGAEEGSWATSASLKFSYNGEAITQPIGTVKLNVGAYTFDFDLPEFTMDDTLSLSGKAPAQATLAFYDNDVLVGKTKSNKNGSWNIDFDLYEPYTYSEHEIYAVVTPQYGSSFRSETKSILYQYVEKYQSVDKVTMFYENPEISAHYKIDFAFDGSSRSQNYVYYIYNPSFTFLITFKEKPDEDVGVDLIVICSDGSRRTLKATWNKNQKGYVAQGDFYTSAVPVGVEVSLEIDSPIMASKAQREKEISSIDQSIDEIKSVLKTEEGSESLSTKPILSEMEISEEVQPYFSEETLAAIENYNESVRELKQQIASMLEQIYAYVPDYQVDGNTIICNGEKVTFRQESTLSTNDLDDRDESYSSMCTYADAPQEHQYCEYYPEENMTVMGDTLYGSVSYYEYIGTEDCTTQIAKNQGLNNTIQDSILPTIETSFGEISDHLKKVQSKLTEEYDNIVSSETNPIVKMLKRNEIDGKLSDVQTANIAIKGVNGICKGIGVKGSIDSAKDYGTIAGEIISKYNPTENPDQKLQIYGYGLFYGAMSLAETALAVIGVIEILKLFGILAGVTLGVSSLPLWGVIALIAAFSGASYLAKHQLKDVIFNRIKASKKKVTQASQERLGVTYDPSGYVYEAVASNRVSGVTTTIYEQVEEEDIYGDVTTRAVEWYAEAYDQENPLITDAEGRYMWDVPQGMWQVKYEKEGYETAYSDWLPVPPPQLDVNVGIVSYESPQIEALAVYTDELDLTFSKYVRTNTITKDNLTVIVGDMPVEGTWVCVNAEVNPSDEEEMFASVVRFVPSQPFALSEQVTVNVSGNVISYAGVDVDEAGLTSTGIAGLRPCEFTATSNIQTAVGQEIVISLQAKPAEAVSGQSIHVYGLSDFVELDQSAIVLDEKGHAEVTLKTVLPGECSINFLLGNTGMTASTNITIKELSELQVERGDVNIDGQVNLMDARLAKRIAMKDATAKYTTIGFNAGDLDGNGNITVNEARKIKRVVLAETTF